MFRPTKKKRERMGVREAPQIRCAAHLTWIRTFNCLLHGFECSGKIEAAHVRTGTDGAMSVKPSDTWSIPLCSYHHKLQHDIGESAFEKRFKIDMKMSARHLASKSPHRGKWEQ